MRFTRNLAVLLNYRSQRSLIFTPNKRPRGTPMQSARAGEARPRGKAGNERRKACFHPGGSGFHLPRGILSGNLPHSSCYTLDTFSRLEEGFYRYALCKKLACSAQLSQSAKSDFYTQQTPPWHADAIGAGRAQHDRRGKMKS